jgi:hypothetical protein
LQQLPDKLHLMDLGCPILPSPTGTFLPTPAPRESDFQAFRMALAGAHAQSL